MNEILRTALAALIGYLLGSVLPARVLALRRGVDIGTVGDGNPGLTNAFKGLGTGAGVLTAAYDLSVGVVAIVIARWLGVPEGGAYFAGVMAVVGHRFPAFYEFRGGGQGMAACAGLLLYGVAVALSHGWLTYLQIAGLVAILAVAFALTRSDHAASLVMLPVLVVWLVTGRADRDLIALVTAAAGYIWIVQLFDLRASHEPAGTMREHPQR